MNRFRRLFLQLADWSAGLLRPLADWSAVPSRGVSLAVVSTAVGALELAWFTRPTDENTLAHGYPLAILATATLLVGVWFAGCVLRSRIRHVSTADVRELPSASWAVRVLAVALLTGAISGTAMGQLGDLLSGFHHEGDASYDPGAVQGPSAGSARNRIDDALFVWSRYTRPDVYVERESPSPEEGTGDPVVELPGGRPFEEDPNAPTTVLTWFFGLDAGFFVPSYFATLGSLLYLSIRALRTRRQFITDSAVTRPGYYSDAAKRAAAFLIVAAVADQLENATGLMATTAAWLSAGGQVPKVSAGWAIVLTFFTWAKIIFFTLTLLFLTAIGLYLLRNAAPSSEAWSGVRSGWQSVVAVRVQIMAVALFAVLMSVRIQMADTFRRWTDDWWVALIASIFVIFLAFAIWHTGWWLTRLETEDLRGGSRETFVILSLATVLAIAALCLAGGGFTPWGVALPLVIVGIMLLLNRLFFKDAPVHPKVRPGSGQHLLPSLLSSVVVAAFGLAIVKSSSGEVVYAWMRGQDLAELIVLFFLGVGLTFFSLRFTRFRAVPLERSSCAAHPAWMPLVALLTGVAVWTVLIWFLRDHVWSFAEEVGTASVLAGFLTLVTYVLSGAVGLASSVSPTTLGLFRTIGLRRTPVISLLLVWGLAASLLPTGSLHHVQVERRRGSAFDGAETLRVIFEDWRADNCLLVSDGTHPVDPSGSRPTVPLVLISSSGGGVRAAVWTAHVTDRLFGYGGRGLACDRDPRVAIGGHDKTALVDDRSSRAIFAMSGISGGGLGFAQYVAQLAAYRPEADPPPAGWVQARLKADSLAATLAWMLYVEGPWSLLRFDADIDRADVLAESWAKQWPDGVGLDRDFLSIRTNDRVPLLIMNGASAESGCRFNGSILDGDGREREDAVVGCLEPRGLEGSPNAVLPATIDLVDFVCNDEIMSLAEAALLTARFPAILPVGEIQQCLLPATANRRPDRDPEPETFVVDGGYLEGSGTATALDLWNSLEPLVAAHNADPSKPACIVPVFVQIDNSYLEPAGPGDAQAPPNLLGLQELSAVLRNRNGYTTASRQALQIAFGRALTLGGVRITYETGDGVDREIRGMPVDDRYIRISPLAHPGAQAPLGWTLSADSFEDLFEQYERYEDPASRTGARPLVQFDRWFQPMRCTMQR